MLTRCVLYERIVASNASACCKVEYALLSMLIGFSIDMFRAPPRGGIDHEDIIEDQRFVAPGCDACRPDRIDCDRSAEAAIQPLRVADVQDGPFAWIDRRLVS